MIDIDKIKKEDIELYMTLGRTYVYYIPTSEIISEHDFMNFIEKNKITNINEFKIISTDNDVISYYIREIMFNKLFKNSESFSDKLYALKVEIDFALQSKNKSLFDKLSKQYNVMLMEI